MRRGPVITLAVIALGACAPGASAQAPGADAAAKPARARLLVGVPGSYRLGADRVAFVGRLIRVHGVVSRYAAGQVVTVRFTRSGRTVKRLRRTVKRIAGSRKGYFNASYRPGAGGRVRVRVVHARTTKQARFEARDKVDVIRPEASYGSGGLKVRFLQQRLYDLKYRVNRTGVFDNATGRAVIAFRKVNRFGRVGRAGPVVYGMLARKEGKFKPKYPGHGRHVEADLRRQVLALIDKGGRVFRVFHMSSGKPSTPTIRGSFHVYSKTRGTNSLGMVNSNYFYGGYAIHGYHDVPTYPASHGCLRVPIPNARQIYKWMEYGTQVDVYRR